MKKLLLGLLAIATLSLSACENTQSENGKRGVGSGNFEVQCEHESWHEGEEFTVSFLRDLDTDIMYVYYSAHYQGSISVYYNSKGEPMTYKEFEKVHNNKYHQ